MQILCSALWSFSEIFIQILDLLKTFHSKSLTKQEGAVKLGVASQKPKDQNIGLFRT